MTDRVGEHTCTLSRNMRMKHATERMKAPSSHLLGHHSAVLLNLISTVLFELKQLNKPINSNNTIICVSDLLPATSETFQL